MHRRSSDATACPVCGKEYAQRVVVARGDRWDDLYAGTPFSFFKRYYRRCTARYDTEADADLPENERAVYFHEADNTRAMF